jgi:GR25 family glycosyltransferase involved in LPS biosynthesis
MADKEQVPEPRSQYTTFIIGVQQPIDKMKYLQRYGINPIWFKGVDGKRVDTIERLDYLSPIYAPIAPYNARGCAIAHMRLWETFLQDHDMPYALILEDDVVLLDGFKAKLEDSLKRWITTSFDILHLGCFGCDPNGMRIDLLGMALGALGMCIDNATPKVAIGLHSYVVTRAGARRLLDELKGKLWCPIDFGIQWLVANRKINRLVETPRIAFQTSTNDLVNSSNVNSRHPRLLFNMLAGVDVDDGLKAGYLLTGSLFRIGKVHLNMASLVIFLVGYICCLAGVKPIWMLVFYVSLSLLDIYHCDFMIVLVHFMIYMIPLVANQL